MDRSRWLPVVLALSVLPASGSGAAWAQVARLTQPVATLPGAFSFIRGARELGDGRVLVADWIEQRVVIVDMATGEMKDVVTEGSGPQDVRLPMGLVSFRGDSTLLLDAGNNRVSVLAPTGRVVRSIGAEAPGRGGIRGASPRGALYFAFPAWAEREQALPDDSVRVVAWMPGTDALRDVAHVQGTRYRKDRSPSQEARIPVVGFAAQDAWVVAASGSLVIVRAHPYRIEFVDTAGAVRLGPAQTTQRRAVTAVDKRRYVLEFAASSLMSGRGEGGGMGRAPLPAAALVERQLASTEWATEHPPFDAGRVHLGTDGRVWVGHSAEPGKPVRYDLFDGNGRLQHQVELRPNRRVILVGARGVYVAADDEDGVQSIELYRAP